MPSTNAGGHPDEVVRPAEEVPSTPVSEAAVRHQMAESDQATPQERKQAEVERAHALGTRPDGSYAQLHETEEPTLAVADDAEVSRLREEADKAQANLTGDGSDGSDEPEDAKAPAGSGSGSGGSAPATKSVAPTKSAPEGKK